MGFSVLAGVLVVLTAIIVFMTVKTVRQGYEFTVERFGRFTRVLKPGLHLLVPFIDTIGARVNMKEQVMDIPTQEIITKDNAMARVDGVVFYQVLDAAKAAYEVDDMLLSIMNLTQTNLRTVMGGMDLDELLSKRDAINALLLNVVDGATAPWGIKITRIEVRDIEPPADIVQAMARQMKAERDKRAAILQADGSKQAEILIAEGEKRAAILEAEGRREAAFRDAEAREREAEAEAKATDVVSEAIAKGDRQAINYFVAQKYVEAVKAFAVSPNSKLIFMPLEASNLIGALGGISELFDEISDRKKGVSAKTRGSVPNTDS